MPFKQVFERRVNHNMQNFLSNDDEKEEEEEEEATPSTRQNKNELHWKEKEKSAADDEEDSSTGSHPPRFSTLFATTHPHPQLPPPPPLPASGRTTHPNALAPLHPRTNNSAITLSRPVFYLLLLILAFESTLLFAYTMIGLYNNLPPSLLLRQTATTSPQHCECDGFAAGNRMSPVNNNFYLGGGAAPASLQAGDIDGLKAVSSSVTTSTSSASSSSSTSSSSSASGSMAVVVETATSISVISVPAHTAVVTVPASASKEKREADVLLTTFVTRATGLPMVSS